MQIIVELPAGGTIALEVENADTVESVKQKIEDRLGPAPADQGLFIAGTELDDGYTLQDYAIGAGATLRLTVGDAAVVTATPTSDTTATVTWSAVFGATGYVVRWDGGELTTAGTTAALSGLAPGSVHTVTVTALEGAAVGEPVTLTLPVTETPAPTPTATTAVPTTAPADTLASTGVPAAGDALLVGALVLALGAALVRLVARRREG